MKFKIAALCLLASSGAIAEDTKVIAGFNFTKSLSAEAEAKLDVADSEITEDLDITTTGLYLGYVNEKNNRFMLSYSKETVDFDKSDIDEDVTGFDFDWQFVYGEAQVQPYWGIGFGLHTIDEALILNNTSKKGSSLNGFSFQLMAGIKIPVNEIVEFDVSIQRKAYAWQDIELIVGSRTDTLKTTYTKNAVNFGVGFKF